MEIEKNKSIKKESVEDLNETLDLNPETKDKPAVSRKPNLKYQRDKDREPVKGIFRFYEVPNGQLSFSYKEYKQDPVETFTLVDGQIYTLPLGVAKHLNKRGFYPRHEYLKDESGNVSMRIGQKVRRFVFQSLEFVDVEELSMEPSQVVTVEKF